MSEETGASNQYNRILSFETNPKRLFLLFCTDDASSRIYALRRFCHGKPGRVGKPVPSIVCP